MAASVCCTALMDWVASWTVRWSRSQAAMVAEGSIGLCVWLGVS